MSRCVLFLLLCCLMLVGSWCLASSSIDKHEAVKAVPGPGVKGVGVVVYSRGGVGKGTSSPGHVVRQSATLDKPGQGTTPSLQLPGNLSTTFSPKDTLQSPLIQVHYNTATPSILTAKQTPFHPTPEDPSVSDHPVRKQTSNYIPNWILSNEGRHTQVMTKSLDGTEGTSHYVPRTSAGTTTTPTYNNIVARTNTTKQRALRITLNSPLYLSATTPLVGAAQGDNEVHFASMDDGVDDDLVVAATTEYDSPTVLQTPIFQQQNQPTRRRLPRSAVLSVRRLQRLLSTFSSNAREPPPPTSWLGGDECRAANGAMGVCRLGAVQCQAVGGTSSDTTCNHGYGVCCLPASRQCGSTIRTNRTMWASPLPGSHPVVTTGGTCMLRLEKMSSNICAIRLDLIVYRLVQPVDGSCRRDHLAVSGQNLNVYTPKLCGINSGQHMYIDVDTVIGPIELNFSTVGSGFTRTWQILLSQVECNSTERPPSNCLQYFSGSQGKLTSFNYIANSKATYMNNLNYAVCIRKEAGFCSIVYQNSQLSGSGTSSTFEIVNYIIGPNLATSLVPAGEAGVGLMQCDNDYLVIAGTRLCGDRLNDGTDPTVTNNAPVTDNTNGPFIVQFQSDIKSVGRGFELYYQQQPCN